MQLQWPQHCMPHNSNEMCSTAGDDKKCHRLRAAQRDSKQQHRNGTGWGRQSERAIWHSTAFTYRCYNWRHHDEGIPSKENKAMWMAPCQAKYADNHTPKAQPLVQAQKGNTKQNLQSGYIGAIKGARRSPPKNETHGKGKILQRSLQFL